MEMSARDVGGIIQRGGTCLQSGRFPEFVDARHQKAAIRQLKSAQVDGLVVIGGEGSMNGALALHRLRFPVIGVPASIDNDIYGTQMAIGVDTALNTIMEAIDKLRDTASSHRRAFIIETMGRECGFLALISGIIGGAEMILIPEKEADPKEVAEAISDAHARGKTHAIVVVAEGSDLHASALMQKLNKLKTGFDFRLTILGHIQRGGRPTAFDRLLATRFGVAAVEQLLAGKSGLMVGLEGREIVTVPLSKVCTKKRRANLEYYRLARMLAK
jgi:6-phosphofructokinase 1